MLGFPQPEEVRYGEVAICGITNCAFFPGCGSEDERRGDKTPWGGRRRFFGFSSQGRVNESNIRIGLIDDRGFTAAEKLNHPIGRWKENHHSENLISSDQNTKLTQYPLQKKTRAPEMDLEFST